MHKLKKYQDSNPDIAGAFNAVPNRLAHADGVHCAPIDSLGRRWCMLRLRSSFQWWFGTISGYRTPILWRSLHGQHLKMSAVDLTYYAHFVKKKRILVYRLTWTFLENEIGQFAGDWTWWYDSFRPAALRPPPSGRGWNPQRWNCPSRRSPPIRAIVRPKPGKQRGKAARQGRQARARRHPLHVWRSISKRKVGHSTVVCTDHVHCTLVLRNHGFTNGQCRWNFQCTAKPYTTISATRTCL